MAPRNVPRVVHFTPDEPDVELIVQVSNFVQRKGGLWSFWRLGEAGAVMVWCNRSLIGEVFVGGPFILRRTGTAPPFAGESVVCNRRWLRRFSGS